MKNIHPLQTKAWADFRTKWGNEVLKTKYGYLTLHKLPFINKKIGMFIRGPELTTKMLSDLSRIAKEQDLIFIKLEPFEIANKKTKKILKQYHASSGKTLFTQTSFWIDLSRSEGELMASFHKKTRYNIQYARRKGVVIQEDNSKEAFEIYLKLMRETVERQGFYAHNEKYHRLMWQSLRKADIAHLLVAKYKGKIHTAWILFAHDGFLYYPYGASSFKQKNLQTNSAMMWGAIQFGKAHHLKTFDLWGREKGKGFTRFKEGFHPEVVEFVGTWDLVVNQPLYQLYKLLEFLRWVILRTKSLFAKPSF